MASFAQRITKIEGLSDRRRLPRLGSIRLGIKVLSKSSGKEYPKETDYFVCPPEVQDIYGPKPKELDVMLPLNDIEDVFPQAYKFYGSSKGLKCHGNGNIAYRVNDETKEMEECNCPCNLLDEGKCKASATLMVMLPKVSVGGVYQIRTGSFNSIVDVNSGLDYVTALVERFAMIPLKLKRTATETHHDDKKQTHYTLQIILDADINTLNLLRSDTRRVLDSPRYQLPAPLDENPEMDPPDEIIDEEPLNEPIESEIVEPQKKPVTKKTPPDRAMTAFVLSVQPMKKRLNKLTGSDEVYYNILDVHGKYEHCNQITDEDRQKEFIADIAKEINKHSKKAE